MPKFVNITAGQGKRIVAAVRGFEALRLAGGQGGPLRPIPQAVPVAVRNDTGQDLERGAIVGLAGPIFLPSDNLDEFQSRIGFSAVKPVWPYHAGQWGILQTACASGDTAPVQCDGFAQVKVYVNAKQEWYGYADITDGSTDYLTCYP